jgi:hypothetical protein
MGLQAPQPLDDHHVMKGFVMKGFDCGDHTLNQWLQQRALANQRSGATRTVVVGEADHVVKAYIALASGAVAVAASPGSSRRNMPDPIPVVVLARLAICHSVQGQLRSMERRVKEWRTARAERLLGSLRSAGKESETEETSNPVATPIGGNN